MTAYGLEIKYKAMLVFKGFSQVQRVDYTESLTPVTKVDSIKLVLAIVASKRWEVHHIDVKSDFIHGDIHENIHIQHPECFIHDPSLFF